MFVVQILCCYASRMEVNTELLKERAGVKKGNYTHTEPMLQRRYEEFKWLRGRREMCGGWGKLSAGWGLWSCISAGGSPQPIISHPAQSSTAQQTQYICCHVQRKIWTQVCWDIFPDIKRSTLSVVWSSTLCELNWSCCSNLECWADWKL